jgi:hypothetical protein
MKLPHKDSLLYRSGYVVFGTFALCGLIAVMSILIVAAAG